MARKIRSRSGVLLREEEEEKKSLEALDSEAPEKGLNLYLNYILE